MTGSPPLIQPVRILLAVRKSRFEAPWHRCNSKSCRAKIMFLELGKAKGKQVCVQPRHQIMADHARFSRSSGCTEPTQLPAPLEELVHLMRLTDWTSAQEFTNLSPPSRDASFHLCETPSPKPVLRKASPPYTICKTWGDKKRTTAAKRLPNHRSPQEQG